MRLGCGLKILPRRSLILKTVNTECMVNFAVHLIEGGKDQNHAQNAGNDIFWVLFSKFETMPPIPPKGFLILPIKCLWVGATTSSC